MKIKDKKLILPIGITIGIVLASIGTVGALNGWFGGGGSIPSDTFTRGLVGYWGFDEGSGTTAYDGSGNSNTGTLTNGPKWAAGKVGGALQFDGVDDYISVPNNAILNPASALTLEAWIYPKDFSHECLFIQKGATFAYPGYALGHSAAGTAGKIRFNIGRTAGETYFDSATTMTVNNWYHVVAAYDGTTMKIYINGVKDSNEGTPPSYETSSENLWIGNNARNPIGPAGHQYNGLMDDVRIYNRVLTDAEVKFHYNRGGPVAQWKFDEGSGTTAYDSTDNNNDGTLGGGTADYRPTWTTGKHGNALSFDGTNDYVDAGTGDSLNFGTSDFTIGFWMKTSSATRQCFIAQSQNNDGTAPKLFITKETSGMMEFYIYDGTTQLDATTTNTNYHNGNWHHFVGVVDRGVGIYLYQDGILDKSNLDTNAQLTLTNNGNLWLGKRWDGLYLSGLIDDVRIYNYARTLDEIRLDYNAGFAAHFGPSSSCDDDPGACMDYGLVGNWGLDEGSGTTAYDKSDYANTGTLTNGPKWATGIKPLSGGQAGGDALQFDGVDDYVSVLDSDTLEPATGLTIEAWINPNTVSGTQVFLIKGRDSADPRAGYLMYLSGSTLVLKVFPGSLSVSHQTSLSVGTWHHIVGRWDGSELRVFINGVISTNTTAVASISYDANPLIIGQYDDLINYEYNGLIDEVRIYNRALTAAEVKFHYNRGGPVGYWKFDEGSGTTAYDSTNNSNDGTLGGGTADYRPTWTTGKHGNALSFDGTNDYVDAGNNTSLRPAVGTIEFWVVKNSSVAMQYPMGKYHDGDNQLYIGGSASGLNVNICIKKVGNWVCVSAGESPLGEWHHLAFTFDGSYIKTYKDGILINSTASTFGLDHLTAGNLKIGSMYDSPSWRFFNGLIDDVRVYNYVRTPEEIRLDYNAGFAAHFGPSSSCDDDPGACMDYGLVGNWGMDEGSGTTAYDKSDYANNGTLTNGPKWATGKVGGGLQFDGSNDYVNLGTSAVYQFGTNPFTLESWVKTTLTTGDKSIVVWHGMGDSGAYHFTVSTTRARLAVGSVATGTSNVADGQWHHIVGVRDVSGGTETVYIYVDGVLEGTGTITPAPDISPSGYFLELGVYHGDWVPSGYLTGLIDEVRIYNRALSATEIRYHYNRGGPVGYWKFDEGEGDTAYDESQNNNDGNLAGTCPGGSTCPTWVSGKYGSALSFDGSDDYVSVPTNSTLTAINTLTLNAWIKTNIAEGEVFLEKRGEWQLSVSASGDFTFSTNDLTPTSCVATTNVNNNNWHFAVGTWDGSNYKVYVDGILENTCSATGTIGEASPFNVEIGKYWGGGVYYFTGFVDDVRIYNYARTVEQIYQDYNAGLSTHFK